jgi:hypothetical protein
MRQKPKELRKKKESPMRWPLILYARERHRKLLMSWLLLMQGKLPRPKESQMNLLPRLLAKEKKRKESPTRGLLLRLR